MTVLENKEKILIIEDEPIVSSDIEISLEDAGYDISGVCISGEEAAKKIKKGCPDLVIMDVNIQGKVDGITFASKICLPMRIPVIYISACLDKETLDRAKTTLPCAYLSKPYKEGDLMANVVMALHKKGQGKL